MVHNLQSVVGQELDIHASPNVEFGNGAPGSIGASGTCLTGCPDPTYEWFGVSSFDSH